MRRTSSLLIAPFQGFQRFDQNTSPSSMYSPDKWSYQFSQVMPPPVLVNRVMSGPYVGKDKNVNRYRKGIWVDLDMHPAMQVALEPYLKKLQLTRTIPNTDPAEAIADFEKVSPLVGDEQAVLNWLAKVIQLCGHKKAGDAAVTLWNKEWGPRFMQQSQTASSSSSLSAVPPIGLIEAILYATSTSNKPEWKAIFEKCLKNGWNLTPKFSQRMWSLLLITAGCQNDAKGVRMILEEMLDVQVNLELVESVALVRAFNALTDKDDYNFAKKYLFNFSPNVVNRTLNVYKDFRGRQAESLEPPLPDNEKMFYHVAWHNNLRQPQRFSPRQLYFNYKPNFTASTTENKTQSGADVVKEKIAKWKEEGLLPEEYEYDAQFEDKSAKFKNTMRHEHWAKLPKILKNPKYGYCGEH